MNKCAATPGCQGWVLVLGQQMNCNLFESVPDPDKNALTGKNPFGELVPLSTLATKCTFSDPLGSFMVSTPLECLAECQANEFCEAWQAKLSAAPNSLVTCTLFFSANNPTTVKDFKTLCGTAILPGSLMGPLGGKVLYERNILLNFCRTMCADDLDCVAWQYSREGCTTYKENLPEPKQGDNAISSYKQQIPNILLNASYATPAQAGNTSIRRGSRNQGSQYQPATVKGCMENCKSDSQCTAWTWKGGMCELFSTAPAPTEDNGALSGLRSTVALRAWDFLPNTKCTEGEVPYKPQPGEVPLTVAGCAQATLAQGMRHFSFAHAEAPEQIKCYMSSACTEVEAAEYLTGSLP